MWLLVFDLFEITRAQPLWVLLCYGVIRVHYIYVYKYVSLLECGKLFNPLDIGNHKAYQAWRDNKLNQFDRAELTRPLDIQGKQATDDEIRRIVLALDTYNMCLYRLDTPETADKAFVKGLGQALGLHRLDGNLCSDEDNISSIQVMDTGRHTGYIPYTDRQLTWHSDGYYNDASRTIGAMILHCVRPAASGGENLLLDHEIAYIQLREQNPEFVRAFMQPDALTIPPNIENGKEIRAAQSGPVFSLDSQSGRLHMRYSARTRNIQWKDDSLTQEAVECMKALLSQNNPYVITYRMQGGEGIIANNVLHNRTSFVDAEAADAKRLLYRARYYDRVMCPEEIE